MNNWIKAGIAGLVIALLFFLFSDKLGGATTKEKYTQHIVFNVGSDDNGSPVAVNAMLRALETRLEKTGYKYKLAPRGRGFVEVSLFSITDTISPRTTLPTINAIAFREMYNLLDIPRTVGAIDRLLAESIEPQQQPPSPAKDSLSKEVSSLLDSMNKYELKQKAEKKGLLIKLSTVDMTAEGLQSSTELGVVKTIDTAKVRAMFDTGAVKATLPPDLLICFGTSYDAGSMNVYAIRNKVGPLIPVIDNRDIVAAVAENTNGQWAVDFEFSTFGGRKWTALTKRNIGRGIAFMVDGYVMSAPKVFTAIEGTRSFVSGDFSQEEAERIAATLTSNRLPGSLHTVSVSTIREKATGAVTRKLLIAVALFLVSGAIAFFIFKSLKST